MLCNDNLPSFLRLSSTPRCITVLVCLIPFCLCLSMAQPLLLLKTVTYVGWILAFSLFPFRRPFNPREYSIRKYRLRLSLGPPDDWLFPTRIHALWVLFRIHFVSETYPLWDGGRSLSWLFPCLLSAVLSPGLACFLLLFPWYINSLTFPLLALSRNLRSKHVLRQYLHCCL